MAKTGRKGYGEELKIKEHLGNITPKMFAFIEEVMDNGTKSEKMRLVERVLPKIIDKGLPQEVNNTHEGEINIKISKEIATKYETPSSSSTNSTGKE